MEYQDEHNLHHRLRKQVHEHTAEDESLEEEHGVVERLVDAPLLPHRCHKHARSQRSVPLHESFALQPCVVGRDDVQRDNWEEHREDNQESGRERDDDVVTVLQSQLQSDSQCTYVRNVDEGEENEVEVHLDDQAKDRVVQEGVLDLLAPFFPARGEAMRLT